MITEILDQIPELAVMYLVNAVAFDAEWETPYDESQIQDATFYAEDGSGQEVSMMYDTTYRYLTMEHAEGFCRAYKEGYDFVALLPAVSYTHHARACRMQRAPDSTCLIRCG